MNGKVITILMTFSGNVNNGPRNGSLNGGDVLDSRGILTFDLLKLKVMTKAHKLFM